MNLKKHTGGVALSWHTRGKQTRPQKWAKMLPVSAPLLPLSAAPADRGKDGARRGGFNCRPYARSRAKISVGVKHTWTPRGCRKSGEGELQYTSYPSATMQRLQPQIAMLDTKWPCCAKLDERGGLVCRRRDGARTRSAVFQEKRRDCLCVAIPAVQ